MKHKVKRALQRIYISVIRAQSRRATEHMLRQLSKRELDDIGINASDIPYIISKMK